jgi:hypothetical protein
MMPTSDAFDRCGHLVTKIVGQAFRRESVFWGRHAFKRVKRTFWKEASALEVVALKKSPWYVYQGGSLHYLRPASSFFFLATGELATGN